MDDRTLLEKAAKAAGYVVDQRASFKTWRDSRRLALLNPQGGHTPWNAEEDDGDALRLAVRLEIDITFGANYVIADGEQVPTVNNANDPDMAVRRAIVRAAAAMADNQG